MGLVHFKGENVVSCVAILRNVLLFLGYGTARSKAPPTIMDTLIDVFLRCSNVVFINNLRNTRDFHRSTIDTPEKLFSHVQSYYNNLLIKPNGWIRAKNKLAFLAELPELAAMADFPQDPKPKAESSPPATNSSNGGSGNDNVEQDFKGCIIDCNPPKPGESTKRDNNGCTEYWCGKCPKGG